MHPVPVFFKDTFTEQARMTNAAVKSGASHGNTEIRGCHMAVNSCIIVSMMDVDENFRKLVEMAFEEDLGRNGDVTSRAIFSDETCSAKLVSKDEGILCGIDHFAYVMTCHDADIKVTKRKSDSQPLVKGEVVAELAGPAVSILESERIAMNFLSFLSGIATAAAVHAASLAEGSNTVLLDTRKTLPGYRSLSKYAVGCGGGRKHRMGLHDMVMIKDNHIDAAGSLQAAVEKVRAKWGSTFRIEVECRTSGEVEQALQCGVDVIMLDNMALEECAAMVASGKGACEFEASGNMTPERIALYSTTGVDFISAGGLTHSVRAFDFSLQITEG